MLGSAVLIAFLIIVISEVGRRFGSRLPPGVVQALDYLPRLHWAAVIASAALAQSMLSTNILLILTWRSGAHHFHRMDAPMELFASIGYQMMAWESVRNYFLAAALLVWFARGGVSRCILRASAIVVIYLGMGLLEHMSESHGSPGVRCRHLVDPLLMGLAMVGLLLVSVVTSLSRERLSRLVVAATFLATMVLNVEMARVYDQMWQPPRSKCGDEHCNYCG